MNYATGHAANTDDMFVGFDTKKLKATSKDCIKAIGDAHKIRLAHKIWKSCVNLVLLDIIDNSDTFKLPTNNRNAEIYIKGYDRDKFIKARLNGKWPDIDYLATNFTGYLPTLKFQRGGYMIEKPIYLDNLRKLQIIDRVNSGKTYY